jgi:hypothetical protein
MLGASLIFWFITFFASETIFQVPKTWEAAVKNPRDMMKLKHRLATCVHGVMNTLLAAYWYATKFDMTCGKTNSILEMVIMSNTFGHFIIDLVYMQYKGFLDMGNLIHHSFGLGTYFLFLVTPNHGNFLAFIMWPGEWSNVAMHYREILKKIGWRYTTTYYLNEKYYFLSYIFGRTVVYGYGLVFHMYNCSEIWLCLKIIFPLHIA